MRLYQTMHTHHPGDNRRGQEYWFVWLWWWQWYNCHMWLWRYWWCHLWGRPPRERGASVYGVSAVWAALSWVCNRSTRQQLWRWTQQHFFWQHSNRSGLNDVMFLLWHSIILVPAYPTAKWISLGSLGTRLLKFSNKLCLMFWVQVQYRGSLGMRLKCFRSESRNLRYPCITTDLHHSVGPWLAMNGRNMFTNTQWERDRKTVYNLVMITMT